MKPEAAKPDTPASAPEAAPVPKLAKGTAADVQQPAIKTGKDIARETPVKGGGAVHVAEMTTVGSTPAQPVAPVAGITTGKSILDDSNSCGVQLKAKDQTIATLQEQLAAQSKKVCPVGAGADANDNQHKQQLAAKEAELKSVTSQRNTALGLLAATLVAATLAGAFALSRRFTNDPAKLAKQIEAIEAKREALAERKAAAETKVADKAAAEEAKLATLSDDEKETIVKAVYGIEDAKEEVARVRKGIKADNPDSTEPQTRTMALNRMMSQPKVRKKALKAADVKAKQAEAEAPVIEAQAEAQAAEEPKQKTARGDEAQAEAPVQPKPAAARNRLWGRGPSAPHA